MDNYAELEKRITILEDLEEIKKLKAEYAKACDDSFNTKTMESMFAEDAIWDGGDRFGKHVGKAAILKHFGGISSSISMAMHYNIAPSITVNGNEAEGTWYQWQTCLSNGKACWFSGVYKDKFVKIDGKWYFKVIKNELTFATLYDDGWERAPFSAL